MHGERGDGRPPTLPPPKLIPPPLPPSVRNVFTVNGKFGVHTIQAHRGDVLEVEVVNNIPADYPDVHEGITLHWHGLTMPGSDFWYDGAAYVTQCPLKYGKKQTYRFLLVDGPGLFWWHR